MKLKVTFERQAGPAVDLVVETDATATIGDVAAEIAAGDPRRGGARLANGPVALAVAAAPAGGWEVISADKQVGEAPIISGSVVRIVTGESQAPSAGGPAVAAAVLRVESGPFAGREIPLRKGSTVIGRAGSADAVIDDPLISRQHARVEVGRTIELVDLNSANGLVVDGGVVRRLTVRPRQTVTLGDTQITISLLTETTAVGPEAVGGSVAFNRSPVVEARFPAQELPRPTLPSETPGNPFPWLLMIAPIAMGLTLYAVTRNVLSLLFVVMSPMMMTANYFMTRTRRKHVLQRQIDKFRAQLAALETRLAASVEPERQVRNAEAPASSVMVSGARALAPSLWKRRPEHWNYLHLRIGTGTLPSRVTVAPASESNDGLPEYEDELDSTIREYELISGVPVTESFALAGGIGVAGPPDLRYGVARSLLAQLVALHSPAEVVVAAIGGVDGAHEFEWLKWLPHTSSAQSPIAVTHLASSVATAANLVAELEALVAARVTGAGEPRLGSLTAAAAAVAHGAKLAAEELTGDLPVPTVVLLVADDALIDRSRIVQLAERGPSAGLYTLWTGERANDLPAACRTVVDLSAGRASVGYVRLGLDVPDVSVETMSKADAASFARAMSPVLDSGAAVSDATDLPRTISMTTLLGRELTGDAAVVVDRWRQNFSISNRTGEPVPRKRATTLRALVGQSGADSMYLDLRTHGPHALVGGTTGAGKSEFLQTWVLGLAAEYSPDRVTFLFVDYKGGSAFAECVNLPHSVGIVTDLTPYLVRRALESLKAELRRREELFARKKVKDILDFERLDDPDCPPALILVIDEFAALVGEVPEFVDGVVDVAQRGRSLGIHLIMATQRPAGVIRDNLRANTNLRIALRMADEADSVDVVGEKVAAGFEAAIPGRAVAKTGPGRLTPFQAAYSGGWTTLEPPKPTVVVGELRFGADLLWEAPPAPHVDADPGPNDLSRAVTVMRRAAAMAAVPTPSKPWLPALGELVDLASLAPRNDREIPIGLVDLPKELKQAGVYWRPDVDGNLAVYGTSGSGKSVVLRTIAAASAITPRGGPVHVYGIDCASGGLRMLSALPHVGAVISGDDSERVLRLFRRLKAIVDDRAERYSAADAENIVSYRASSSRPDEPRILVLIDGFASFRADYEVGGPRGQAYDRLQQLIAEGRQLGIHVVFTADRPGAVPSAIASGVPRRVVLRLAEDGMYRVLDVPADVLSADSPPGRAIVDGKEVQIALFGESANAADQSDALRMLARSIVSETQWPQRPQPVESMPSEVSVVDLPDSVGDQPVLGIGDTALAPIGFEPRGVVLLGGGPGSGRSNALAALSVAVKRWNPRRPMFYLGNRRSALPDLVSWDEAATSVEDAVELAKSLTLDLQSGAIGPVTIMIESIGDFLGGGIDSHVTALTKAVKRSEALLVAEADTPTWGSSQPLFTEIKSARRGVLLQPDSVEGDIILKTAFPRVSRGEFPRGRGYYVAGGRAERVQLPLVPADVRAVLPIPQGLSIP